MSPISVARGCRVPGARVPGARVPGCRTNWPKKRKGLISLVGLIEPIGLVDLISLIDLIDPRGLIHLIDLVDLIDPIDPIAKRTHEKTNKL